MVGSFRNSVCQFRAVSQVPGQARGGKGSKKLNSWKTDCAGVEASGSSGDCRKFFGGCAGCAAGVR